MFDPKDFKKAAFVPSKPKASPPEEAGAVTPVVGRVALSSQAASEMSARIVEIDKEPRTAPMNEYELLVEMRKLVEVLVAAGVEITALVAQARGLTLKLEDNLNLMKGE